jgi:hypothetical protein
MKLYRVMIPIVLLILGGCSKDNSSTTSPETSSYTITPTAGMHGTINPSTAISVESGQSQRFVFSPDTGYKVDTLLIDGVKVDSSIGYTFVNVKANHTIHITFKLAAYFLTPSVGPNGSITPSNVVGVDYGGTQRFIFTPYANYKVDTIYVDGARVDSTTSYTFINVTANHTIRGVFKYSPVTYTITPTSSPNGTINPSVPTSVVHGSTQHFTFTPASNYQVDSVFVDGVEVDSLTGYSFVHVTSPHTIRVVYTAAVAETWTYPSNGVKFAATVYSSVSTVQNGSRFEVQVVYYNMTNVFGTAIELSFPNDKVSIRDVIAGPYISGSSALVLKKLDNAAGRISLGATFTAGSGNTATGSGVVLKLKCRAKNTGSSPFTINTTKLQILQSDGSSIPNFNTLQIENLTIGIQ